MDHLYSLSLFQYSTLRQKNQLNYAQILPLDQKDDFFAFSSQSLAKVNLKSDEMPFCRRREGHLVPQGAELKEYISDLIAVDYLKTMQDSFLALFKHFGAEKVSSSIHKLKITDEGENELTIDCDSLNFKGMESEEGLIHSFATKSKSDSDKVAILLQNNLNVCDIETEKVESTFDLKNLKISSDSKIKWDSSETNSPIMISSENKLSLFDPKSGENCLEWSISKFDKILCFDQNPNLSEFYAFGGNSHSLYIYDLKNTSKEHTEVFAHSHCITGIEYNSIFDQLILTSSLDGRISVCNVPDQSYNYHKTLNTDKPTPKRTFRSKFCNDVIPVLEKSENPICSARWSLIEPLEAIAIDAEGMINIYEVPKHFRWDCLIENQNTEEITA